MRFTKEQIQVLGHAVTVDDNDAKASEAAEEALKEHFPMVGEDDAAGKEVMSSLAEFGLFAVEARDLLEAIARQDFNKWYEMSDAAQALLARYPKVL